MSADDVNTISRQTFFVRCSCQSASEKLPQPHTIPLLQTDKNKAKYIHITSAADNKE